MNGYFPMFFNLTGKKVFLAGAGTIALRRVETLLAFGAEITVAAPQIRQELKHYEAQGCLCIVEQEFEPSMIKADYFMVIAATSQADVNREICRLGKERGILVNTASAKNRFAFPSQAIVRQGNVFAGFFAGGKDHGLVRRTAAAMRIWLKQFLDS